MKVRNLFLLTLIFSFLGMCFMLCGFTFFKKPSSVKNSDSVSVQVKKQDEKMAENLWCVTFQLVWNDFMDKFNGGKPVKFVDGNPLIADELNKRLYTSDILSPDSYYKVQDKLSLKLKKQIEKEIKKKFNETSDILDMINWNEKDSFLFYVMLKKDFNFISAFDKLASAPFNNSTQKVKYFGVNNNSSKTLRENIDVLFYNSDNEYAIRLITKENEDVILFRTDSENNFNDLYNYVISNTKYDSFEEKDILKVPFINVDETISYDDLCGRKIENSDYIISQALQTIKFKMDNKGGTLKSEAAIAVMKMSLIQPPLKQRIFSFDKPFVLFLKESNKDKPYYAVRVKDTSYLVTE